MFEPNIEESVKEVCKELGLIYASTVDKQSIVILMIDFTWIKEYQLISTIHYLLSMILESEPFTNQIFVESTDEQLSVWRLR